MSVNPLFSGANDAGVRTMDNFQQLMYQKATTKNGTPIFPAKTKPTQNTTTKATTTTNTATKPTTSIQRSTSQDDDDDTTTISSGYDIFSAASSLIGYLNPFQEAQLSPEAQAWEQKTASLVSQAQDRGWVQNDNSIMYPDTVEGRTWAQQYENNLSQRNVFVNPATNQYREEYIDRGFLGEHIVSKQNEHEINISTEKTITFPFYKAAEGFATWWDENITKGYDKAIAPSIKSYINPTVDLATFGSRSVLSTITGASHEGYAEQGIRAGVNLPATLAPMIGMIPPGVERLVREGSKNPMMIPSAVTAGLAMQAQGLAEGIKYDPVGTSINLYAGGKALQYGMRGVGAVSPLQIGSIEVPTGRMLEMGKSYPTKITKIPETFKITGAYLRNPIERPLIGKTEYLETKNLIGITHGTAAPTKLFTGPATKALDGVPIGTGYLPQSLSEWALIRPVMETRLTGTDSLQYFSGALEARKLAANPLTRMEAIEPWGKVGPSTIPAKAWPEVMNIISKHSKDIVVYGSTTERAMLGKWSRTKLGDLDLDIRTPKAEAISQEIYNAIKPHSSDLGPLKHEVSKLTGDTGRYTARLSSGEIVLDLHPHWERRWDLPGSELVKSNGINLMPIGRTLWGKTMFFLNYHETVPGKLATIEHYSGRFKDPADISLITRKMARDILMKPIKIDIGGMRAESRMNLAVKAAEISDTFARYTYTKAPEGIDFLRQAKDPIKGFNLKEPPQSKFNLELGFQTKVVKLSDATWHTPDIESIRLGIKRGGNEKGFLMDAYSKEIVFKTVGTKDSVYIPRPGDGFIDIHTHPPDLYPDPIIEGMNTFFSVPDIVTSSFSKRSGSIVVGPKSSAFLKWNGNKISSLEGLVDTVKFKINPQKMYKKIENRKINEINIALETNQIPPLSGEQLGKIVASRALDEFTTRIGADILYVDNLPLKRNVFDIKSNQYPPGGYPKSSTYPSLKTSPKQTHNYPIGSSNPSIVGSPYPSGGYPKASTYPSQLAAPYPSKYPKASAYPSPKATPYPASSYPTPTPSNYVGPSSPIYPGSKPPAYPNIQPTVQPPTYPIITPPTQRPPITPTPVIMPPTTVRIAKYEFQKIKQVSPAQSLRAFDWTIKNPVPTIDSVFGTQFKAPSFDMNIKLPKVSM